MPNRPAAKRASHDDGPSSVIDTSITELCASGMQMRIHNSPSKLWHRNNDDEPDHGSGRASREQLSHDDLALLNTEPGKIVTDGSPRCRA
jgi:hypothetical protein